MLSITFGENVVLCIIVGVAAQPRSGVFNHFVVKVMKIYSLKEIGLYNQFVVRLVRIYYPKRTYFLNLFMERMMGVNSPKGISYSDFVIKLLKVYSQEGINRLACSW